MPRSPFIWYEGRPYLVVNFDLDNTHPATTSPAQYRSLLQLHGAENVLMLRLLTEDEAAAVEAALDDAAVDAWAHIVGASEER